MSVIKLNFVVPEGVDFANLKLARDSDGHVSFDWHPIEAICTANNIDITYFRNSADAVAEFVNAWYERHIEHGGAPDKVQEQLREEVLLEDKFGYGFSHQPGRT